MTTNLTADGMIPVPEELQKELKFSPGQALEPASVDGELVARPVKQAGTFEKWRGRGRLPVGQTVDDYLGMIRDDNRR